MSDEMKLIKALCEALGFKVETDIDWDRKRMPLSFAVKDSNRDISPKPGYPLMRDIDEDDMAMTHLKYPAVSYRLVPAVELPTILLPKDTDKIKGVE